MTDYLFETIEVVKDVCFFSSKIYKTVLLVVNTCAGRKELYTVYNDHVWNTLLMPAGRLIFYHVLHDQGWKQTSLINLEGVWPHLAAQTT